MGDPDRPATLDMSIASAPEVGQLVEVRRRRWIVSDVARSAIATDPLRGGTASHAQHLVDLASVEDDAFGDTLQVIWEIEPGARVIEKAGLPAVDGFDDPERLLAFLDAVHWGAVTSADRFSMQAPFRSGIAIKDYQLEPLVRALEMPRVNLLIADDVGFGKTVEAGLVLQELLLRHRARRILIVCPASLQLKWQEEMREKFGLKFKIVDTSFLKQLRRERSIHANPWSSHPLLITSMDWVKNPTPLRWFRDILPEVPTWPRTFDVLVVDEAHNVAPAGSGNYALDSLRTQAVRYLSPHFEHRIFMTATPHNGYTESWTALLAMLEPQRFAVGVPPDEKSVARVRVRRLKDEIVDEKGERVFADREVLPLEVHYDEEELAAHALLSEYIQSHRAGGEASDFVMKLLKKRLISSPAAFLRTLEKHRTTLEKKRQEAADEATKKRIVKSMARKAEESRANDEDAERDADEFVVTATRYGPEASREQTGQLEKLARWAEKASGRDDAKLTAFLAWLDEHLRPGGAWNGERVIVFTEYKTTLDWLHERLATRFPDARERVATIYGGMDADKREATKAAFQASPEDAEVRVLLATDAASEGIDLQNWCYRLIHWEIPWNPSVLEQRNGRVDRYGQRSKLVKIWHFVPQGWEETGRRQDDRLDGDLEFLFRVAKKVDRIRRDLGSMGPVIAWQIEEFMLGRRKSLDTSHHEKEAAKYHHAVGTDQKIRERVRKLHERLMESRQSLRITPENVRSVVRVALDIDNQQDLLPVENGSEGDRALFALPPLPGSWAQCAEGLPHPYTGKTRPLTFDHDAAEGRDDVVLAHLEHPLVARSLRLLRAEIWSPASERRLRRVTAFVVPDDALDGPAVLGWGRLVVIGSYRHRLHEELVVTGGRLSDGRFRRLKVGEIEALRERAEPLLPNEAVLDRLAADWPRFEDSLLAAFEARRRDRMQNLESTLQLKRDREAQDTKAILQELEAAIRERLADESPSGQATLPNLTTSEIEQIRRNETALRARLAEIPAEIEREVDAVHRRYAEFEARLFPAAIGFLIPRSMAGGDA